MDNFLVFQVGREKLGLRVGGVEDVFCMGEVDAEKRCLVDCEETRIPIVDPLGGAFDGNEDDRQKYCILVLELKHGGSAQRLGLIVERMARVVRWPGAEANENGLGHQGKGMPRTVRVEGDTIRLLSLDELLDLEEHPAAEVEPQELQV